MLAVLALALAVAAPAVSSSAGLRLDWEAPAGCPDQAGLRGRVTAMLGERAVAGAALEAWARVRASEGGWSLELELLQAGGRERRALRDRDCEALADAAALMIAVAIDPLARPPGEPAGEVVPPPPEEAVVADRRPLAEEVVAPEGPELLEEEVVVVPEGPEPREVPPVLEVMSRGWLGLGLRAGVGLGFLNRQILPGPYAVLELGLGLEGRGWRVELNGALVPPVRGVASEAPEIGGVFRLGAGELRGCGVPTLRRAPLAVPLCAGLQVGAMHGRGTGSGLMVRQEARAPWLATRVGGALRWRPGEGRALLWLGLDAIVALTRPSFETAGGVQVHAVRGVGAQAWLGVELRLR